MTMIDPTNRVRDREWTPEEEEEQPSGVRPSTRLEQWISCDDGPVRSPAKSFAPAEAIAKPKLFVEGARDLAAIDPNDVKQGGIGDCYFLASVAALAKTPDGQARIRSMIHERTDADGKAVYDVTLYVPNPAKRWHNREPELIPQTFTVRGPFVKGHAETGDVDKTTGQEEIWPLVLEAAFAQAKKGYDVIDKGGHAIDAMACLTGKKAEQRDLGWRFKGIDVVLALGTKNQPGRMVVLESRPGASEFDVIGRHAYMVDGIALAADGSLLVALRNPWGHDSIYVPIDRIPDLFARAAIGER